MGGIGKRVEVLSRSRRGLPTGSGNFAHAYSWAIFCCTVNDFSASGV
jgi:hypothetical protein